MPHTSLPHVSEEVLAIPEANIPETLRALIEQQKLSTLMARIHRELSSDDQGLRQQSRAALNRLGFPE
ncbi:hypothetical protein [Primorskyibacter sp. 2E233]|uniref:hypothetical protein n=1 Tax=Primorskyibacter sp. 2E233 TaxID=3413431 RepID=UPI003BF20DCA